MNTFQKILKKYSSYLQAVKQEQFYHKQLKVQETPFENGLEEYQINGNKVFVATSQEKCFKSMLQNLAIVEQLKPKCVLLDTVSNRVLKQWIEDQKQETSEESLLGKRKFTKLFVDVFPEQDEYFTINDNNTYVYLVRDRKIQFKDQLSIAYYACNDPKMHIMIAKPDEILQIEDIVTNFSLEELKNVFMHTIEEIKLTSLEPEIDSSSSFADIQFLFKSLVMKNHTYLFENYIDYQAALLQKSSRIQEKSCLFTQQFFFQQVVKASKGRLFDHNDFYKNENIDSKNKDELLEKIVIAGYIIDYVLRVKAMEGQNPFENTKFQKHLSKDDVPKFLELHQFYADQLYNLQNFIIQTNILKQPDNVSYFTFENTLQKFRKNAAAYKYEFNVSTITKIQQSLMLQDLFQKQVKQIIQTRIQQGINQKDILEAMKNIGEDHYTRKDLKNYLKIVMEANASLGYPIKFPGSLKETMLPFIQNLQVEKTAEVASRLVFKPFSRKLSYARLPDKKSNPNEFTDDEDEDIESDEDIRYVISADGQSKEVPEEIQNMSIEEIQEIADEFKQFKFQVNENGDYVMMEDQDTNVQQFKQEDVDKFFVEAEQEDKSQPPQEVQHESQGRRVKRRQK